MSPHDMTPYRAAFDAACARLGWSRRQVTVEHERDWGTSWREAVWLSAAGDRLFSEDDLTEGLVKEIIRLADAVEGQP